MNANIRFKEKMREGVYKTINAKSLQKGEKGGGGVRIMRIWRSVALKELK